MISILQKKILDNNRHMKELKTGLFLVFLLAFIFIGAGQGQITSTEVDALVEDAMEKFTVAGVAVGIVKDGEIIHARGYGVKSVKTSEKVNEHTSFAIASNS